MDVETSQRLFQAFDPMEPLRGERAGLYVPREASVVRKLVTQLKFPGSHRKVLVGAVGSGKSTELYRILQAMEDADRHTTVLLDLFAQFKVDDLSAGQVLFLVALAVLGAEDIPDDEAAGLHQQLAEAYTGVVEEAEPSELDLGKLLKGLAIFVSGIALGPAGAAGAQALGEAVEAVDLSVSLPGKGKALRPNDLPTKQLSAALREVVNAARNRSGKRYLVLVDGLDKVQGHDQLLDLFCSGVLTAGDVRGLDLVYSAPPSLLFEVGLGGGAGFEKLRLGLFDLFTRKGEIRDTALESMRRMMDLRIQDAGLRPEDVWPTGADGREMVDRMIAASGGLTRDLIHIVRRAVVRASEDETSSHLTGPDIETGIREHAKEKYLYLLDLEVESLLETAWKERQRPGGDKVPHLLNENLILYYENGQPWCRPHPLVMGRLRERFPDSIRDDDADPGLLRV